MKKKWVLVLLALAMVFSMASCGNSANKDPDGTGTQSVTTPGTENNGVSSGKKAVTVGLNGTVTDVAPYAATNTVSEPIRNVLYQSLFTTANVSSMETIPVIGKSWE